MKNAFSHRQLAFRLLGELFRSEAAHYDSCALASLEHIDLSQISSADLLRGKSIQIDQSRAA